MAEALHTGTGIDANNLGKYRLIAALGRGGMASVHLAVVHGPSSFNKLVVIKEIHEQYVEDAEVLGMFLDEARLAARLNHPNVVQTNDVGQEGDRYFLAMEYLDGQPLSRVNHRLSKHGGLPLRLHLQVIVDLLGGLHHAHELCDYDGSSLGVVHRDITPQNVFVTYDGVVKIVDFGIAKARHASNETRAGIIKGKIAYMAPEQAMSQDVDRRADVFAVGVMLWEAVTETRPWKGVDELSLLQGLLAGQFPRARSIKPDVPKALEAIIEKALAHDRAARYATAADLQVALEGYLESTGERPQQRELSKLLSMHFAAERAKIKAIIEDQLKATAGSPRGAAPALPLIDHATGPEWESAVEQRGSNPSLISSHGATGPAAFAATVPTPVSTRPRLQRRVLIAAGALVAGAAMIAAIGLVMKGASPKAEAAALPATARASAEAAPAVSATVHLRITATPAQAHVFIDDEPVAGNPFSGDLHRDERAHRIRVEAPGFVSWSERVTLDRDRDLALALAPSPTAAPASPPATGQAAPASPTRPGNKQRNLDARNPWR